MWVCFTLKCASRLHQACHFQLIFKLIFKLCMPGAHAPGGFPAIYGVLITFIFDKFDNENQSVHTAATLYLLAEKS